MWLCRPLATSIDSDEPPRLSLCGAWRGYLHGPTPCWAPVAGPLEQQVQKGSGCQEGWSQPQGRHLNSWGLDRSRDMLQRLLGMQGLPSGQLCVGCSFFSPGLSGSRPATTLRSRPGNSLAPGSTGHLDWLALLITAGTPDQTAGPGHVPQILGQGHVRNQTPGPGQFPQIPDSLRLSS